MVGDETTLLETLHYLILKSNKELDEDAEADRASVTTDKACVALWAELGNLKRREQNKERESRFQFSKSWS